MKMSIVTPGLLAALMLLSACSDPTVAGAGFGGRGGASEFPVDTTATGRPEADGTIDPAVDPADVPQQAEDGEPATDAGYVRPEPIWDAVEPVTTRPQPAGTVDSTIAQPAPGNTGVSDSGNPAPEMPIF
jgi:hypothetical protein